MWSSAAWQRCHVSLSALLFVAQRQKKSKDDNGKTGIISGYDKEKDRYEVGHSFISFSFALPLRWKYLGPPSPRR